VRPVRFLVAKKYNPKKGIFSCAPVCACQIPYVILDQTCAFVSVKSQSTCWFCGGCFKLPIHISCRLFC